LANEYPRIDQAMEFDYAKSNFFAAARHGLNAQFEWIGGKTVTARDLIVRELLPNAQHALEEHGISKKDIDRYLGIVRERVESQQTGAQWSMRSMQHMSEAPIDVRLRSLTAAIHKHQRSGKPVHEWPLAELYRTADWFPSYRTVGQFMSTKLFTVRPNDPVDLAARMMDWRQVRHVPVENDQGKLVGLLSFRALLRLVANSERASGETIMVADVMRRDPETVVEDTSTLDALATMKNGNVGCLPVVDDEGRLVGMVTVDDLLKIASKVLEDFLRDER